MRNTCKNKPFRVQKVQQQLKDDESVSKDDASPVTVADYGTVSGLE